MSKKFLPPSGKGKDPDESAKEVLRQKAAAALEKVQAHRGAHATDPAPVEPIEPTEPVEIPEGVPVEEPAEDTVGKVKTLPVQAATGKRRCRVETANVPTWEGEAEDAKDAIEQMKAAYGVISSDHPIGVIWLDE